MRAGEPERGVEVLGVGVEPSHRDVLDEFVALVYGVEDGGLDLRDGVHEARDLAAAPEDVGHLLGHGLADLVKDHGGQGDGRRRRG